MMKRLLCLLLAISFVLTAVGCGDGGQAADTETGSPAAAETVTEGVSETEADETVAEANRVVDASGNSVQIPEDPSSATIASVYAVSVPFIVALGLSDRTVAVNPKTKFWTKADEKLSTETVGRGVVDLEALAALEPTVLIHRSNDPETVTAVNGIGIDVLCITVESVDDVKATLRMLGEYFGVEERAEEVCAWIDGKFDMISGIVSGIPEEERVAAMMMGGELGRVAGNDMLQSWMIEAAGGKCVVDVGEDHNWYNAGVEKVFEWDPEFIFCTGSTGLDYDENDMMNDGAWSAVKAVKEGNIFTMPAKTDCWDLPGLSCALGTMYMLYKMYPSYFSAEQLQTEVDDYYTFMFGKTFSGEDVGYSFD